MKTYIFLFIMTLSHLIYGQTSEELCQQGREAYTNKDFKKSLKLFELAIASNSLNVDAYDMKAQSLIELNKHSEAFTTYNKAIKIFPDKDFLYNNRGNMLLSFQKFDLAIDDYNTAMSLSKNDTIKMQLLSNRAAAKISKRDFEGAYEDLQVVYKQDSSDIATLTNLGAVCDEIGRGDETLRYLFRAIKVDPTFMAAYGNIGFKYQEMGNYAEAIKYFDKVIKADPKDGVSYCNKSYNLLKLGDLKGAIRDIDKSILLYPENSYAYRTRALILIARKQTGQACTDLQTALDKGFTESYGEEVINLQKEHCKK